MNLSTGQLPAGYGMRAPREEDAEAVVTLLRACDVAIFGEPDMALYERVGMRGIHAITSCGGGSTHERPESGLAARALRPGDAGERARPRHEPVPGAREARRGNHRSFGRVHRGRHRVA